MAVVEDFVFSVVLGQEQESDEPLMQLQRHAAGPVDARSPEGSCEFCKESLSRAARGM